MKKTIAIAVICLLTLPLLARDKLKYDDLEGKYRRFYEIIYHISSTDERNTFLKLQNNRDRDIFIRMFWEQRDPTPGTEVNERKDEYLERFEYVNSRFHIGAGRAGWRTDRGRFYMILGKPNSIEYYENLKELYPIRVWNYYGDRQLGLPTYFTLTFYRPNFTTEWKFYNPAIDGPHSLIMTSGQIDPYQYREIYAKIKQNAPDLVSAAFGIIPNEFGANLSPSLRNNIVLKNIYESPVRAINTTYASSFLNLKGFVNMETSLRFIDVSYQLSTAWYKFFDFPFVNISLKPETISVGESDEEGRYFFNFLINVSLQRDGQIIYKYKKNFDYYFEKEQLDRIQNNGLMIHDAFPVAPGSYKLLIYTENTIGKESNFLEKQIEIRDRPDVLSDPVLGYRISRDPDNQIIFFPYNFNNTKLYLTPKNVFRLKEKPYLNVGIGHLTRKTWEKGELQIILEGLNERNQFSRNFRLPLSDQEYRRNLNFVQLLSEEGLYSDYYNLTVKLVSGQKVLDERLVSFTVSPNTTVAYPMESYKRSRIDNPFFFYSIVADQYQHTGRYERAVEYYQRALKMKPGDTKIHLSLLRTLLKQKKYNDVLVRMKDLQVPEEERFDYFYIKGLALFHMKDYPRAQEALLEANRVYDSDIGVINLLGYTFCHLKNYPEAVKAFKASLQLNSEQERIQKDLKAVQQILEEEK